MLSSNIGAARMAMEMGTDSQKSFLAKVGMLRPVSVELPELGRPLYPSEWRPINTMTIAFGHGIAVSPLHVVSGVAAMVNGGIMRPATLIKRGPDEVSDGQRVISPNTSNLMRELFRLAAVHDVQIRRMNYRRDSLEDIFLAAMKEDGGDRGRP